MVFRKEVAVAAPRRYGHRSYDAGLARARQHIHEAKLLSQELGGTDEDVKRYFFGLSSSDLRPVLVAYEREHSKAAREYAESTIPLWRCGSRKMSGQVAARLFKLLPRFMPLNCKYALVESLWDKLVPRTEYSIAFGPDADAGRVGEAVDQHLTATVNGHTIPDGLQRRFNWLADGDAQLMQQLLNHFLVRDRQQAIAAVSAQVALILGQLRSAGPVQGFRRELKLAGHTIYIFLDPLATNVTVSPGQPRYQGVPHYAWIWILSAIAAVILLILFFKAR
jgi:hypothetical protein